MTAMLQTRPDAWAGVLGTYRGDLVRTARSRLGAGGADAEDVVHDVVVRVLRGGKDVDEMATPGAYLRRAVGNECVSRWRRTARDDRGGGSCRTSRAGAEEAVLDRLTLGEAVRAHPAAAAGDRADRARRPPDDEVAVLLDQRGDRRPGSRRWSARER